VDDAGVVVERAERADAESEQFGRSR